jgi:hypothetical protein
MRRSHEPAGERIASRPSPWHRRRHATLKCWQSVAGAALWSLFALAGEAPPRIEVVPLPPLIIAGQPARAHTQGLEIVAGSYYVTARREDVQPKRAFLLRTAPGRSDWAGWDLTPGSAGKDVGAGGEALLDHPGGFQASGGRLWIPLAESRRQRHTLVRAYVVADLEPDKPARPAFEFSVDDHIGAVAVSAERGLLVGASWDTESVYLWDLQGTLNRTSSGAGLAAWGLGVATGPDRRPGVAVQDWKIVGDRLIGSGLRRGGGSGTTVPESWLVSLPVSLEAGASPAKILLPTPEGIGLAREGMAIAAGVVHFLPEDLGATNRLFRVVRAEFGL